MTNQTDKKKFNLNVSPLWNTQSGNLMGLEIDDEIFARIQELEKGGKLMVKFLDEGKRTKDTSPHAYLEYISKDSVQAYKVNSKGKANARTSANTPAEGDTI